MVVRKYKEDDFDMISSWWEKHNEIPLSFDAYPENGFIVDNVACGFLYKTDGRFCFIESLMYNPDSPRDARQEALDEIVEAAASMGKEMGYRSLVGFTDIPVVVERAKRLNFQEVKKKYSMIIRGL